MTTKPTPKKRVRALFQDSAVLFNVDDSVTLEQITALLATAGRGHGTPLVVEVCALKI